MSGLPNCPQCGSQFTYEDGAMLVCPECAHEWSAQAEAAGEEQGAKCAMPTAICCRMVTPLP
jgi:protein PhnA